ncbi:MAG TPA: tRNA uridine-5-carboxymethylaminomethyl(34) synthesis GTPase MnmE [Gemmatimonadaceae bacterium]|nr:tRNA uridine-5-carboxymethylaminomethyl(34) synthesis GTPase MnmE [Gemmatimonadaceae bacterium]
MSGASADRITGAEVVHDGDTIAAVATPAGRGALAIVRVSGPGVTELARRLLDPPPATPRRATRCVVRDGGEAIDDVVATLFVAPHSFTGEDLLELGTHGGLVTPAAVLAAVLRAGAREAERGEFTRRAVLNGKLDLLQAEAVGDMIDARSSAARRAALRQLDGGLSRRIGALRQRVLDLEALLAYDIDFPEEDDGPISRDRIHQGAEELLTALETLLATAEQGTLVLEGALVVLAGAPNVGKSSLFNALLGEARAIVTDVPGTTRDAIEAVLDLPAWPLRLVDTAGLHDTTDVVERLGIETSSRYLAQAALVLACGDDSASLAAVASAVRERTDAPIVTVRTKGDLVTDGHEDADVVVSAHTGTGLRDLLQLVERRLSERHGDALPDTPGLTRARHQRAVGIAAAEIRAFDGAWRDGALPASVAAIHVRAAADALGELIGVVRVDDVLDTVFRRFCVGK